MAAAESEVQEQLDLPQETPEPAAEPSLREQLISARDEAVAKQGGEAPEQPKERVRGPDGKFQKAEGDPAQVKQAEKPVAKPAPAAAVSATKQPQTSASAPTSGAPQGWKPEVKQLWETLPAPVQAEIARREADFHKTITAQDQIRTVGSEYMRVANQHSALIQARGGNPVALFNEFLGILGALHHGDQSQRLAVIRDVALRNGIDPRAFGQPGVQPANGQPANAAQAPTLHPAVAQMLQEWSADKRQRTETQERMRRQAQEQSAAELAQANQEIEAFRAQPGHEHFDSVAAEMEALLNTGSVTTLEDAYDRAVHANPETRKALEAAALDKRRQEEAARREAARKSKAAGSVRSGYGNAPEAHQGSVGSVREDLKAAFAAANARV